MKQYSPKEIANALDYAVLSPLATLETIRDGCTFANKHGLKSICVAPVNVELAAKLHGNVCSVIGFPHGNVCSGIKYMEAIRAVVDGARELDVVVNYGRYLGGNLGIIKEDLRDICAYARANGVLVKSLLESCYYTSSQLRDACRRCVEAGVHFVKTSTGFGKSSATPGDVAVMLDAVKGPGVQVKASGGIKNYGDARQYLDLGCTRLGSSRYLELLS